MLVFSICIKCDGKLHRIATWRPVTRPATLRCAPRRTNVTANTARYTGEELRKAAAALAARDPGLIALREELAREREELAALKRELAASAGSDRLRAGQPRGEEQYTWGPGRVAHAQQAELASSFEPSPNYYAPFLDSCPDAPSAEPPLGSLSLPTPQVGSEVKNVHSSALSHKNRGKPLAKFLGPPDSINRVTDGGNRVTDNGTSGSTSSNVAPSAASTLS